MLVETEGISDFGEETKIDQNKGKPTPKTNEDVDLAVVKVAERVLGSPDNHENEDSLFKQSIAKRIRRLYSCAKGCLFLQTEQVMFNAEFNNAEPSLHLLLLCQV